MAGEEMPKPISERRRSRAGLKLNVNFNGGGVVLLLGAAAGAVLASAFVFHRILSHKRRRRSMTDRIQGDSGEHLAPHETKEFAGDEGGERNGANSGGGVVQVNSHESLEASVQISQVDHREMNFNLLEEGKGEVAERSPTTDIELVDGDHGKLAGCRDSSSADISSFPQNACRNLGIGNSLGEHQLRCVDEELLAAIIKEEHETSFLNCKEDDEEDNKKAYLEDWGEMEEVEEKLPSSNQFSEQPRVIEIVSSPTNVYNNLEIDITSREDQLRYENKQLVVDSVREEGEVPCKNSKKEEDTKKAYVEEWIERDELEEKVSLNLKMEELRLLKDPPDAISFSLVDDSKTFQNLEMAIAIEERKLEEGFKYEMYNSILEFVISRANEMATSSFDDKYEMNPLIEEIEPYFNGSGEAKKALNMTQIDSGKHHDMVIMEDEIRVESGGFKDAVRLDILCVEQDNKNGDASDDKMVEGSKGLYEETAALPRESSFTAVSELETISPKDSIMVMAEGDVQLIIAYTNGIIHIEEDKMEVEESNYPSLDEGIEGLIDESQGTESYLRDNPAMIIAVEEKTRVEDNVTCFHNDVIQEEKTEEIMLNGFTENVESSGTEENLRENEKYPLTESQRIENSLEQDNLMEYKESPLIQVQGKEPVVREEKACLEDWFPLFLESNMKIVQPIQDNNLCNSEKTLEREECRLEAGAEELGTSLNEEVEEREHETSSVQYPGLETRQYSEAHEDKLEREIEYPQPIPVVKKGVGEIHKELQAQITEEDEKDQIIKLSFDLVEKGVKMVTKTVKQDTKTELIYLDGKLQSQVEDHENNVSNEGKQQRIATKKVNGIEYMFMGYPKGHIFLVMTLAIAFAVLAFLFTKDFITRITILENFISS